MKTKITFVRHGQSQANLDGIIVGFENTPLTKKGIQESIVTAKILKDEVFDIAFCSPLNRAKDTFKTINEYLNVNVIYDDRLKERNYGKFENKPYDFINNDQSGIDFWRYDKNIKFELAENVLEFYERVESFFNDLKTNYSGKNILVVGHGGVYRVIYCLLNGLPENNDLLTLHFGNAKIFKFEL
jgi:broad specificity phosphatase PhoE